MNTSGFFVQVKEGDTGYMGSDYSGLFVFTGATSTFLTQATEGARVTIPWVVSADGWAVFFHRPYGTFDLRGAEGILTPDASGAPVDNAPPQEALSN